MSDHAARSALLRLHHREAAIAPHYTGFAADMHALALANAEAMEAEFVARKVELVAAYGLEPEQQNKPYAFSQGVAIIPVHGTLLNRFAHSWGFVTGYNFIRQQTALAGQDPDVKGIFYDTNTYGGEAAGCFECSADIKRLANGKPTLTSVDSNCYSAGMALACGTDRIVCTPSGGVGSVGVVAMHISVEKMLDKLGVEVTFIHAGAHKVDGNPFEKLSPAVKADVQKSIDKSMSAFVKVVADGREMTEKEVRDTEARTYRADDALSIGFIDAIASPQEAMLAFLGELSGSNPQPRKKESAMSTANQQPAATTPNAATAESTNTAAVDTAAIVKAERARMSGIQGCEEAKGREDLAKHLAFNTSMSVDDAKAVLVASPKAAAATAPAATVNPLAAAMEATGGGPKVGATDTTAGPAADGATSPAASILANAKLAGVVGYAGKNAQSH